MYFLLGPGESTWEKTPDTNLVGKGFKDKAGQFEADTAGECQTKCEEKTGCESFTYKSGTQECNLKRTTGDAAGNDNQGTPRFRERSGVDYYERPNVGKQFHSIKTFILKLQGISMRGMFDLYDISYMMSCYSALL